MTKTHRPTHILLITPGDDSREASSPHSPASSGRDTVSKSIEPTGMEVLNDSLERRMDRLEVNMNALLSQVSKILTRMAEAELVAPEE